MLWTRARGDGAIVQVREHGACGHAAAGALGCFPRMPHDLFRPEAMRARRVEWLGPVVLSQPLSLRVLTLLALVAAALSVTFLVVATFTRRSTVVGQLVPTAGIVPVVAPSGGVVSWIVASEGHPVEKGQRLAIVSAVRVTMAGRDVSVDVERLIAGRSAQAEALGVVRMRALEQQAANLAHQATVAREELDTVNRAISTKRAQVELARSSWHRVRMLGTDGFVSAFQVEQQESEFLQALAELQATERQALALSRNIQQIEQAVGELATQRAVQRMEQSREQLVMEQERVDVQGRAGSAAIAPVAGTVASTLVTPGQTVQAGQTLLNVVPSDARLHAELLVPSSAIGFIRPGDRVLLRYHAFPYQKFGHQEGRVARISRSALAPSDLGPAPAANLPVADRMYRVIVSIPRQAVVVAGQSAPLRPGMALQADILGERRRLLEWLFEPLYALGQRTSAG